MTLPYSFMTYVTESGSVYEVDEEDRVIRRIGGTYAHAPDGPRITHEWREYKSLHKQPDNSLLIVWGGPGLTPGTVAATLTSPIVEVR